ncbi:unnamed protein product [Wuchereria bancrofti]|uniref:Uncharacterized protein n=1 Tax=Wuchereria bancrofti TaxID=6293 RepID=A0A3P7EIU1_WUCBA|nr:unnamed protein product [Wuchereria bancrofti]
MHLVYIWSVINLTDWKQKLVLFGLSTVLYALKKVQQLKVAANIIIFHALYKKISKHDSCRKIDFILEISCDS